jgi:hypothetical protein
LIKVKAKYSEWGEKVLVNSNKKLIEFRSKE